MPNINKPLAITIALLTAGFALPLYRLLIHSLNTDLYSHLFLIPAVTIYLIVTADKQSEVTGAKSPLFASIPLLFGVGALLWYHQSINTLEKEDYLAAHTFAYVMTIYASCLVFVGLRTLRTHLFPISLLLLFCPFPVAWEQGIEHFFQYASADASHFLFHITGTTYLRDGQVFRLPGITLEVAPQCSGIRSSLVLFITALVASHMFLKSKWRRVAIVLFVIPLAIVRNAVRITTLGLLCVYDDPDWIESDLHHRGGPIFFALSLIPFFIFLYILWKTEAKKKPKTTPPITDDQKQI